MAEQFEVIISADSQQLAAELQKAQNSLRQFEAALKKSTNIGEIQYLTRNIALLKAEIDKLNVAQGKLSSGSNKASYALNDLSRIVQDAPYGFIGISNNINPLLESFQRLQAESKATGQSIGTLLVGALSGPAGLGLAVGVASAAITFMSTGLSRWIGNTKEAASSAGEFSSSLENVTFNLKKSREELDSFIKSVDDLQKVAELEIRLKITGADAISEYKRKLAELGVVQESILTKQQEGVIPRLQVAQDELTRLGNVLNKFIDGAGDYINFWDEASNQSKKLIDSVGGLENAYLLTDEQLKSFDAGGRKILETYIAQQKEVKKLSNELKQLQLDYKLNRLEVKTTEQIEKDRLASLKKSGETLSDALKKFEKSLEAIQATGISLGTPQFDIDKDKIKAFENILKKIIEKFNVSPKDKIYLDLEARLNELQFDNLIRGIQDKIKAQPPKALVEFDKKKPPELPGKIKIKKVELPSLDDIRTAANLANLFSFLPIDFFKPFSEGTLDKIREQVNSTFESIAEDAAIIFGQTLGDALSGQASIGDFFKGLFNSLGNNIEELGKFLVKTAIELEVIQKTLFSNPFLALAGGIALIAIGRAIANATSKNAFAVGTRYAPGGMALVGERGPEMINLPRGSQVIPAAQTANMMGGISGAIEVFGMLRGQDIYFSNKKYGQTYKRTT